MKLVETTDWLQYSAKSAVGLYGQRPRRRKAAVPGSWLWLLVLAALSGCGQPRVPTDESRLPAGADTRASVTLRVLVVNDESLADAINRLRGEWEEHAGGRLSAFAQPWMAVAAAKTVDADVIVFPSRYMGELCVRNWLRPVRPNVLDGEDFDAADIFPFVRHELIRWGGQTMGLPLGIDLLAANEPFDRRPAVSFLTYSAPHLVSRDRVGVLFDVDTMKPRIAEPEFIDVLRQFAKSAKEPGIGHALDRRANQRRVPVLGYGDRLVAVTKSSRNAASGFKLAAWLASAEISTQLARAAGDVMPVRRSLALSPSWYDPSVTSAERAARGKTLQVALSGQDGFLIPRIQGIDAYLEALDKAVVDAVVNGTEPEVALSEAAAQWERITNSHDRNAQRQAFLNHLGIAEP
jgi:ABC-type glycerol-3-phosphate transport system substrate-binding protein